MSDVSAGQAKALVDMLADVKPPIVILQIDNFGNATGRQSLKVISQELTAIGYTVQNSGVNPCDLGVPVASQQRWLRILRLPNSMEVVGKRSR